MPHSSPNGRDFTGSKPTAKIRKRTKNLRPYAISPTKTANSFPSVRMI